MAEKLTFKYDREADILYIDQRPPLPTTGNRGIGGSMSLPGSILTAAKWKIWKSSFFLPGCSAADLLELPVAARLRLTV